MYKHTPETGRLEIVALTLNTCIREIHPIGTAIPAEKYHISDLWQMHGNHARYVTD